MEQFRKASGTFLIVLGIIVLLDLVMNLNDYLQNFPSNPIHEYIVGKEKSNIILKIGEEEIIASDHIFHFAALIIGLFFLRIWVDVGAILVKIGKVLITNDSEKIEQLVEKLVDKDK